MRGLQLVELKEFYRNNKMSCESCKKIIKYNPKGHLNWFYDYDKNGYEVIYCCRKCRMTESNNP